ncbi:hypothetical protein ACO22_03408 [Paracoccidioides brasiliensis]|uniref:F-box domain-containing protein n=1 Tax=Paracoccidioides brasiliensis TaxID=121759 RepID=A0A1D2JG52_PARBR|nr:hypothetical protein ACO22_03408 [Paracoccidioides brasiliensis]
MAYDRDSYRGEVPSRRASPVYHIPVQPGSPSPREFSIPHALNGNYSNASTPEIYSPTAASTASFTFRSLKSVQSNPKEQLPFSKPLPQEVFDCIFSHLHYSHSAPNSGGCVTCYMRDLYSLSLTSRAWEKAVRGKLYNKIYIQGNDSPAQLKKYRWKRGSRLRLLRRTLRERKLLANAVFEIRIPDFETATGGHGKQNFTVQEYRDLVASVVMACPNLERLLGLSLPYNHEFDRLTHALSTRKKLKEHAWIIGENPVARELSKGQTSELLDSGQVFQFLNHHTTWSHLETLLLHSLNSSGILEHGVFLRMFNFLPSLRHLIITGFHANDFTDRTLLFLPPLVSLRLENLPGLTENGLAHYTRRPEARTLESLTLIEQNISSLLIISQILASLRKLERFSIVQTKTVPTLPDDGVVFQPLLASPALKYLHWDVACPDLNISLSDFHSFPPVSSLSKFNTANSHLAQSILSSGFPNLESLRAPFDVDPLGAIQSVCRPTRNGQIMVPADRYSLPRSSHGSITRRPLALPGGNNLSSARIRGQTLIDKSSKDKETGIKIVVSDHSGGFKLPSQPISSDPTPELGVDDRYNILGPLKKQELAPPEEESQGIMVHEFTLPLCMGRIWTSPTSTTAKAPPRFILTPDIPTSDADGGLISWRHFLSANQTLAYFASSSPSLPPLTGRTDTSSTMNDASSATPSPPGTSLFGSWASGGGSGNNHLNHKSSRPLSPRSTSPMSPTTLKGSSQGITGAGGSPSWTIKETCDGSWNRGHKGGKDWWFHVERERPVNTISADLVRLEQLF